MKILIISSGFFPVTEQQGGAIEKLIDNYFEYNEKIGDDIVVYSPKISSEKYDRDIYKFTKFRIIDKTSLFFKAVKVFRKVYNKMFRKPNANAYIKYVTDDIISRNEQDYYDMVIFENGIEYVNYFCKRTRTKSKVIIHLHNDYLNVDTPDGKKILKNCYQVWTVSEYIKNRVRAIDSNTDKVKVLSNPLDEVVFNKELILSEKKELKNKLGITDEFVFIYIGRLIPVKGVKELVLAFNNLATKKKNVKLLIVGGNSNYKNTGSYVNKLKRIADSNVIFAGYVPAVELYKYYSLAHAQVVPSLCNEAFGLILLEGMYFNLPIIASNSGGIPEICGDSALYVNRENIVLELEEKMAYIMDNKEAVSKKIENYSSILANYTLDKYCTTFYELLHNNIKK